MNKDNERKFAGLAITVIIDPSAILAGAIMYLVAKKMMAKVNEKQ